MVAPQPLMETLAGMVLEGSPQEGDDLHQRLYSRLLGELRSHKLEYGCRRTHRHIRSGEIGPPPRSVMDHALVCNFCLLRLTLHLPLPDAAPHRHITRALANDLSWPIQTLARSIPHEESDGQVQGISRSSGVDVMRFESANEAYQASVSWAAGRVTSGIAAGSVRVLINHHGSKLFQHSLPASLFNLPRRPQNPSVRYHYDVRLNPAFSVTEDPEAAHEEPRPPLASLGPALAAVLRAQPPRPTADQRSLLQQYLLGALYSQLFRVLLVDSTRDKIRVLVNTVALWPERWSRSWLRGNRRPRPGPVSFKVHLPAAPPSRAEQALRSIQAIPGSIRSEIDRLSRGDFIGCIRRAVDSSYIRQG